MPTQERPSVGGALWVGLSVCHEIRAVHEVMMKFPEYPER